MKFAARPDDFEQRRRHLRELSDEVGAIPFAMKSKFIAACERNIDMAELVHFLDDGGFLVLQHKNAVRTDDERLLDHE